MINTTRSPIKLTTIADGEWLIHDHNYAPNDARFVVAWLREDDVDDVEVMWVRPTPLPTRYASVADVLEDLNRYLARPPRGTRPIPIPHFPPATARGQRVS